MRDRLELVTLFTARFLPNFNELRAGVSGPWCSLLRLSNGLNPPHVLFSFNIIEWSGALRIAHVRCLLSWQTCTPSCCCRYMSYKINIYAVNISNMAFLRWFFTARINLLFERFNFFLVKITRIIICEDILIFMSW